MPFVKIEPSGWYGCHSKQF